LCPYIGSDGHHYSYYDCESHLNAFAQRFSQEQKVMVIVDGPPASTGKHARWPAIDVLSRSLSLASLDIYLDDYVREDEQEVVGKWLKHNKLQSVNFDTRVYPFEKQCFRLTTIPTLQVIKGAS
jgi:DNA repair protein SbcC/Rad50